MMKARRWESLYPSEGQRSDHRAGHYFEGWFLLPAKMSILLIGSFRFFFFFLSLSRSHQACRCRGCLPCKLRKMFFSASNRVLCWKLKRPLSCILKKNIFGCECSGSSSRLTVKRCWVHFLGRSEWSSSRSVALRYAGHSSRM